MLLTAVYAALRPLKRAVLGRYAIRFFCPSCRRELNDSDLSAWGCVSGKGCGQVFAADWNPYSEALDD